MQKKKIKTKKIAITGPESTGKSFLSKQLAAYFQTIWVPEFAREYLKELDRPYEENDILIIAKGQLEKENSLLIEAKDYIFCDTEAIVTKIWSEVKYGRCHPWIEKQISIHPYDLYLLCNIDLPWENDPLREHPDKREFLFKLYVKELNKHHLPYTVVSGTGNSRLHNAIKAIEEAF